MFRHSLHSFALLVLVSVAFTKASASRISEAFAEGPKVNQAAEAATLRLARNWNDNSLAENAREMAKFLSDPKVPDKTIEAVLAAARELIKTDKDKTDIFARYLKYSAQAVLNRRLKETDIEEDSIDAKYKKAFEAALEDKDKGAAEKPSEENRTGKGGKTGKENGGKDDVDDQSQPEGAGEGENGPVAGGERPKKDGSALSNWVGGLGLKGDGINDKVEKWMKQLENKETRWGAAEKLLKQDAIWNKDKALLKNLGDFGLSDEAEETLKKLYAARNETVVKALRAAAHGDPEDKASRLEVTRRVNSAETENKWMQSGFPSIRPELLLEFQGKIKSEDTSVAGKALAEMIGTLNSDQKAALAKKASDWLKKNAKDEALKPFAARMACGSLLALSKGKEVVEACKDLGDFADKFNAAYAEVRDGHKKFHDYLAKADDEAGLAEARAWLFDKAKGNYSEENLMDYLGQRVQSCDKLKDGTEKDNACKDAVRLAKVLGWKDDKGNWNLNINTRDAGTKTNGSKVLKLGGKNQIADSLQTFANRGAGSDDLTDTEVFKSDEEHPTSRSRFQSFAHASSHNPTGDENRDAIAAHLKKKQLPVLGIKKKKVVPDTLPVMAAAAAPKTETEEQAPKTDPAPKEKNQTALTPEAAYKHILTDKNKCARCHNTSAAAKENGSNPFTTEGDDANAAIASLKDRIGDEAYLDDMLGRVALKKGTALTEQEVKDLKAMLFGK